MPKQPDHFPDTANTFDSLNLDILGGARFGSISTPQGLVEKPMLEVILHENGKSQLSNEDAKHLIDSLMWQKQLRGIKIPATEFIAIHASQIISREELMELANKFLDDDESKLYEDQLAAIGIDRRALHTMVLDLSRINFSVAPQVTQTRRFLSTRALAIAGAVLAIGGSTAAGIMSMDKEPEGKQSAPVQPQIKTTTSAKPLTESKPTTASAPTPTEETAPKPKLASAPTPKAEELPAPEAEAPSCQTLPLINKGNGRGGVIIDEAATTEAWKTLGFSVTPDTDTEGQKVYSLKDGKGNEFTVKNLAVNKGKTSISADKK